MVVQSRRHGKFPANVGCSMGGYWIFIVLRRMTRSLRDDGLKWFILSWGQGPGALRCTLFRMGSFAYPQTHLPLASPFHDTELGCFGYATMYESATEQLDFL